MKVGFLGLGIMGRPMAKNLLKAGHELMVFDFNQAAVDELVAAGAKAGTCGKDLAEIADARILFGISSILKAIRTYPIT